jgi:hypothetical protein
MKKMKKMKKRKKKKKVKTFFEGMRTYVRRAMKLIQRETKIANIDSKLASSRGLVVKAEDS